MESKFKSVKTRINKILRNLHDGSLDWTTQVSENSANPGKVTYSCMIHVSDRLEPLTWVCDSWDELLEKLDKAVEELNKDLVTVAYYQGEVARCERLRKYYEEKISEIVDGSTES